MSVSGPFRCQNGAARMRCHLCGRYFSMEVVTSGRVKMSMRCRRCRAGIALVFRARETQATECGSIVSVKRDAGRVELTCPVCRASVVYTPPTRERGSRSSRG